jgi:RecB family exonuclease
MGRVVAVPAGWPLVEAVAQAVLEAKSTANGATGVLRSVSVVCSGSIEGRRLRRAVLHRLIERGEPGMAGVDFTTVGGLTRTLAAEALPEHELRVAGRVELLAAVRAELRHEPGLFGAVAGHRTTHDRLVALYQELTGLDTEAVAELQAEAEGLSADALRVVLGVDGRLGPIADERHIMTLAMARLHGSRAESTDDAPADGPSCRSKPTSRSQPGNGHGDVDARCLVLVHPDPFRAFERRILAAVVDQPGTTTIVAVTGHGLFDRAYRKRVAVWGLTVGNGLGSWPAPEVAGSNGGVGEIGPPVEQATVEPGRAALVDTAAPDEEVRAAVRQIMAHGSVGTPLSSMALLYTTPEPYAGIIHDQLTAGDLPFHGPGHRPLGGSLAGRTLRRLLGLAAHGLERGAVVNFLNSAPIDAGDGREVPALLWDRLSRQAGVIEGAHWRIRLAELVEGATADPSHRSSFDPIDTTTVDSTEALMSFMVELEERLRPPSERTWSNWSAWAAGLLDRYLLEAEIRSRCDVGDHEEVGGQIGLSGIRVVPDSEVAALDAVRLALNRIGALDGFGLEPDLESFEASVDSELDGVVMPGPTGGGLYVGPLSSALHLPFDQIMVVGMVEGMFPRVPREDSLLPDSLRRRASSLLPDRSIITEIDASGAALMASGSRRKTTFLTSRGDLRSNRSRTWPHGLKPLVEGSVQVIASHHEGLAGHGHPASLEDFELRSLIHHVDGGEPVGSHELATLDPTLAAGLARHQHRGQDKLNPYTGGVGAMVDPTDHLFSPTALETYALCPRKYLLQRILRLGEDERPERIAHITGLQRGKLVHRLLYRFVADALAADDVPEPDEPWPSERRAHLFDLLEEEVKMAHAQGITGGQVQTEILRRRLMEEMEDFLRLDDEIRRRYRSRPVRAEHEFGFEESPLVLRLGSGRSVPLRGAVDRVDMTDDGGLLVIDYKGGSDRSFADLDDDPLDAGRRLQLPLYARVLAEDRSLVGPRIGLYWFTSQNKVRKVSLDEELESDMEEVVGAALDGIGEGIFPAVPGQAVSWPRLTFENCRYCDFDRICPTDRHREWERVRRDPAVAVIDILRRPVEIDESTGRRPGRPGGRAS